MSNRFSEVHLVAYLVPKPGREQALAETMQALVPEVLKEPGCIAYAAHVSRERPGMIVMYEVWRDQAALDAHAAGPNIARLVASADDLFAEPPRLELLTRIA